MVADGIVVGRIVKAVAAREGSAWLWTLAYGHQVVSARNIAQVGFRSVLVAGSDAQTRKGRTPISDLLSVRSANSGTSRNHQSG